MSAEKGMHLVNRHLSFRSFLVVLLAGLGQSSPARAKQPGDAQAEAKLDIDLDLDLDEVMEMAQEQVEAARDQIAESVDQARKSADKDVEEARKHASEQMDAARKQLEEARRQWQKQVEETRKQMRAAASSMRVIARRERLTSALSRIGIVAKQPEANGSAATAVQAVTPGSPAEKAGIAVGDVITSVNGYRLQPAPDAGTDDHDASRIAKLLHHSRSGHPIEIEYRRGGEARKTTIQPDSRSGWGYWFHDDGRAVRSLQLPGGWLSLELTEINPALGEYFGTSRGLLVLRASSSPDVKLQAGDVILKIGDEEPSTPRQAVRLLRSYEPGQSIPVEIIRQKKKQTLALQIPASAAKRQ